MLLHLLLLRMLLRRSPRRRSPAVSLAGSAVCLAPPLPRTLRRLPRLAAVVGVLARHVHGKPSAPTAARRSASRLRQKLSRKIGMEVEKLAPVATSPLDACRGRGLRPVHTIPRLRIPTRTRQLGPRCSPSAAAAACDTPSVVVLVVMESPCKVGVPSNGK